MATVTISFPRELQVSSKPFPITAGQPFGRLVAVAEAPRKGVVIQWAYRCTVCGAESVRVVAMVAAKSRAGHPVCPCAGRERTAANKARVAVALAERRAKSDAERAARKAAKLAAERPAEGTATGGAGFVATGQPEPTPSPRLRYREERARQRPRHYSDMDTDSPWFEDAIRAMEGD